MEKMIQVQSLDREELKELMREAASEAVKGLIPPTPEEKEGEYMTRKEAADLLHVSTVTLDSYCNQGWLIRHFIGNRILLRRDQVKQAIEDGRLIKYKRG